MQGEGNATAAAAELVAEEAKEAAKAATKKAKKQKQKARARKQQTVSDVTPTSEPASETSLQNQLDVEPIATPVQGSPSQSRSLPDQDTAGKQPQLQHVTVQASAAMIVAEHSALDKQALPTAAAPCDIGTVAAANVSSEADAKFLDRLFCCPITKVRLLIQVKVFEILRASSDIASGTPPSVYAWHKCVLADT